MVWCPQTISYFRYQCGSSFMMPNGVTQPECVNPWIAGNLLEHTQHCGYWWPGAKAPGHQYPQCWPNIHCIGPVSDKKYNILGECFQKFELNFKNDPVVLGLILLVLVFIIWVSQIWSPLSDINVLVFDSLAPGRSGHDFKNAVLLNGVFRSPYDNALRWMSRDFTNDKSTIVQAMAWCRQAASHYLSQCWPNCVSPYDITRPQWVNVAWTSAGIVLTIYPYVIQNH